LRIFLLICIAVLLMPYGVDAAQSATVSPPVSDSSAVADNDSFSFVVWGHPRGPKDGDPPLYHEEILARITALGPDLLIITGDMISGGASRSKPFDPEIIRSDWVYFDQLLDTLGIPVLRSPGNHDVNNFATRDIYLERYQKPPYALTFQGSRFIILDSVGIDQRKNDAGRYWHFQGLPFDKAQLDFIKTEIANQDQFEHLFFFWHHTRFWSDSNSNWWQDIHPLLKNGKTRAIFTGDPIQKYLYENHDGIHYVASSVFETHPIKWLLKHPGTKSGWGVFRQLDNLQYVRVEQDSVTLQTIVVGETQNKALSPGFWETYEARLNWRQRFVEIAKQHIVRFRHLLMVATVWAIAWMLIGMMIVILYSRFKR